MLNFCAVVGAVVLGVAATLGPLYIPYAIDRRASRRAKRT